MKYALLFFIVGLAIGCENTPTTQASEQEKTTPSRQIPGQQLNGQVRLQARNPMEDPNNQSEQSKKVLQFLTQDFWVITAWVEQLDPQLNRKNQGRYFQFKPDGSFVSGQWGQQKAQGTWTFNGKTALLYLDSSTDDEDGEWRIQMSKDGSVMIWVGTERFNTSHIQVKLEHLLFTPKDRAELGLKD